MGRRRSKDRHLPARMYQRRGSYYYVEPGSERWIPLGDVYRDAFTKYGELTDAQPDVNDDEYRAVWELATPQVQVVMDLSLLTGLRRGDILALTRENLTKQGLLVKTSKTNKGLLFEYTDELEAVLKRALSLKPQVGPGHYLVRSRNGTGYSNSGFSAIWQRLMKKAVAQGVEGYTEFGR